MNQTITIYHNPRCSKSRASLAILEASGLDVDIRTYLDSPPGPEELSELLTLLGTDIAGILRTGEATFKALENPPPLSDTTAWLDIISDHPILLQRPIVVRNGKAVIGRPPENVEGLIGDST